MVGNHGWRWLTRIDHGWPLVTNMVVITSRSFLMGGLSDMKAFHWNGQTQLMIMTMISSYPMDKWRWILSRCIQLGSSSCKGGSCRCGCLGNWGSTLSYGCHGYHVGASIFIKRVVGLNRSWWKHGGWILWLQDHERIFTLLRCTETISTGKGGGATREAAPHLHQDDWPLIGRRKLAIDWSLVMN